MKKLLLIILLLFSISCFAGWRVHIVFKDGGEIWYGYSCAFSKYYLHPGYIWFDNFTICGQEDPDYYVISDYSQSGLYSVEEQDYKNIQKLVLAKGHFCYYEEHNFVWTADGKEQYCWWFLRMNMDEIDYIERKMSL